jgi:ABC-type hemin transport system ATPase subunit
MVTHDINCAAMLGSRIVALVDGRIAFEGPPNQVMKEDVLESVFKTQFLLMVHPSSGIVTALPSARF